MNFSQLSSNERLASYGAIALVLGGLISTWGGFMFLAVLAGLALLVVVFLPQFSPQTALPGSKGSLLAALGIVAAASAVITLLQSIDFLDLRFSTIMFLVGLIGALVAAWAGWQELQAEGGKWQFGAGAKTASSSSSPSPEPVTGNAPDAPVRSSAAPSEPSQAEDRTEA